MMTGIESTGGKSRAGDGPVSRRQAEAALAGIAAGTGGAGLAEGALMLAALARPRVALARYRLHLDDIAARVAARVTPGRGGEGGARARAESLIAVLHGEFGYAGDTLTYDDLQNTNLMRVIDRLKGLPVSLGILYIHAARAQGWPAHGLNFPGHFLVSVAGAEGRAIVDPFAGAVVEDASRLREMLKALAGAGAELMPDHYAPLDDRGILVRLENNRKSRLAATGRFAEAAEVARRMLLMAPKEVSLYRDLGLFEAETGNLKAALAALEAFMGASRSEDARLEAAALAHKIRARIN